MVAQGGNLVPHTLEGVAEISAINNKATGEGIAFWLIAIKIDIHKV
jgi:hypothetical protein